MKSRQRKSRPLHPGAWVEVDLGAIRANAAAVRRFSGGRPLLAVVKSDAYGHGLAEVARALAPESAMLAVFSAEEGRFLRERGSMMPVFVLGPSGREGMCAASRWDLIPSVTGLEELAIAPRKPGGFLATHLKFDTGMGRLGIPWGQAHATAAALRRSGIRFLAGTWTHLSTPSDRPFTAAQLDRFDACLDALREAGVHPGLVHAANSWGILASPRACRYGAVRPGILLYGCSPGPRIPFALRPAMSFKTRVAAVREAEQGSPVSYGHTWRVRRKSRLAVLPAGYSRGINRLLSNRGEVLVRGKRAQVRGRVTMDLTVVDVTRNPRARPGDEAVVFGAQGRNRVSAEEVAEHARTIAYEVLCVAGGLNPRVYRGGAGA